jgi:hypothetical protein
MANFELDEETKRKQREAQALQNSIKAQQTHRESFGPGQGLATPDELMKHNDAEFSKWQAESDEQARRGGVETADAVANAGGVAGFFGGKEKTTHFTAGRTQDTTTAGNKARLEAEIIAARTRKNHQAGGVRLGDGDFTNARDQGALVRSLQMAAQGQGPSAAQSQLMAGDDAARAAAMSLARSGRGGNSGAAMKAALMQQGVNAQQTANASAQLRAQESQAARGELANVLNTARGQDLAKASADAQLQQGTQLANLSANVEQQKQKDAMIAQFRAQGLSLDQAARQVEIQQAQFNAELLARQSAADKGVAMQSSAAGGQVVGAGISAIGALGAAAISDKRAKKNIEDGDEPARKLVAALRPHKFEYKNAAHGDGPRLGVMAQDVEKAAPELVTEDEQGTKQIDISKALSASLAALGSIDKRLAKLEGGKRRG